MNSTLRRNAVVKSPRAILTKPPPNYSLYWVCSAILQLCKDDGAELLPIVQDQLTASWFEPEQVYEKALKLLEVRMPQSAARISLKPTTVNAYLSSIFLASSEGDATDAEALKKLNLRVERSIINRYSRLKSPRPGIRSRGGKRNYCYRLLRENPAKDWPNPGALFEVALRATQQRRLQFEAQRVMSANKKVPPPVQRELSLPAATVEPIEVVPFAEYDSVMEVVKIVSDHYRKSKLVRAEFLPLTGSMLEIKILVDTNQGICRSNDDK